MDFSLWDNVELKDGLTVEEILHILESGADDSSGPGEISDEEVNAIFITPPAVNELTDEDSADEEEGGLIDNLSAKQLSCEAEVVLRNNRRIGGNYDFESYSKTRERKWIKGDLLNINYNKFHNVDSSFAKYFMLSPVEVFEQFIDEEVVNLMVEYTNKYALSKNKTLQVSANEIRAFIGIMILSGYNNLPGKKYYWDTSDDMRNPLIINCMRRDRFLMICSYFHVCDNSTLNSEDKMAKLRPLITLLKRKFSEHFVPCEYINYDESMIKYYGRHSCKQFLRGKPIRFGYKAWCLNNDTYNRVFGKATAPLVTFLDNLDDSKKNYPYHIFTDNLFTSLNLLKHLKERGYNGIGTIRQNRIPRDCPLPTNKEMKRKSRGEMESAIEKSDGVQLCKWMDNNVVALASTSHGVNPTTSVKRYSSSEKKVINVKQPNMIGVYNKYMGGTDRMDEDINRYRINIRSKKWYWPILTWLIDAALNNAWLLQKRANKNITKLKFRRYIVQSYLAKYKTPIISPGPVAPHTPRSTRIPGDVRFDRIDHFLTENKEKKRRRCAAEHCKSIVNTMCTKCNVGLCIKCNLKYHTPT